MPTNAGVSLHIEACVLSITYTNACVLGGAVLERAEAHGGV